MIALMAEPCCCDRCGIELSVFDSTCPSLGTWAGAYLCRGCHFETTGLRVKKRAVVKHKKITRKDIAMLTAIDSTASRTRILDQIAHGPE